MLPTSPIHDAPRNLAGFALLEAVLALAVLAFIAAAATLALPREPGNSIVCAAAQRIASVLENDRNAALRLGRKVVTELDPARGMVRSALRGRPETLPSGITMIVDDAAREIHFLPDGSSSGVAILVHSRTGACSIEASAMTGRVSVEREEAPG